MRKTGAEWGDKGGKMVEKWVKMVEKIGERRCEKRAQNGVTRVEKWSKNG